MRKSSIILAAAVAFPILLHAADARAGGPEEVRVYEENDFFNWFTEQTDRYYTQGIRVEWLNSPRSADTDFLPGIRHHDWCSLVCGSDSENRSFSAGYAVGQNIYTPAEIRIAAPQPNDRPWGGLLYGSRIARVRYDEPSLHAQREDRIEVTLGIVGPASLAREAQTEWHRIIEVDLPRGWDNQLRNEPVLQLRYDTALRWPNRDGGHADIIPRVRANVGNALTSLEAEVTGRIGWNLSGFGVGPIPVAPPPPPLAGAPMARSGALTGTGFLASGNLFVRAGIKAIAHNIFLDGNTFVHNDIRIERRPFVPELAAGVELNLVSHLWLSFQFIHRGSEFETRSGRNAPAQEFGAITIAWVTGR
jgi:lipid A 3-O-deacylase